MKFCDCCELKLSKTQIKNKKYTTKKQIKTKMIDNKIAKTIYRCHCTGSIKRVWIQEQNGNPETHENRVKYGYR